MKKGLLTMVAALICAMTCAFGLVACDNGTPDGETTEVKGKTYVFVELSVAYSSDFPESQKLDEDALTEQFSGTTLVFGTDGTFEWEAMQQTGTYTQEQNVITFTAQEKTYTGAVSGDKVTLKDKMEYPESAAFVTMSIKYTVQKTGADGDTPGEDSDTSDSDSDAPGTTVVKTVTEGEWQEALSKDSFINFTATMKLGDITTYIKADLENNIYYVKGHDGSGYTETYYTKEGDKYYIYDKSETDGTFSRRETEQSSFETGLSYTEPMAVLNFSANYSDFQFDGDKYTTDKAELYNAKFGFENKKLIYAEVDAGAEVPLIMEYTYGGTTITAPNDFIEADPTLNGKTFVFSDMTSDDFDPDVLEEQATANQGSTITFGEGVFTLTTSIAGASVVEKGVYSQSGQTIELLVTEMTMGGESVDIEDATPVQATCDGEKLYIASVTPIGTVTAVYVLKTN